MSHAPGSRAERVASGRERTTWLTPQQLTLLNDACVRLRQSFGSEADVFLVGSVLEGPGHRDVDVRMLLNGDDFTFLFEGRPALWSWVCLTTSHYLGAASGLDGLVDFQIQMPEEFIKHAGKPRNALGLTHRHHAGGPSE